MSASAVIAFRAPKTLVGSSGLIAEPMSERSLRDCMYRLRLYGNRSSTRYRIGRQISPRSRHHKWLAFASRFSRTAQLRGFCPQASNTVASSGLRCSNKQLSQFSRAGENDGCGIAF